MKMTHALRASHSGILVGIQTVLSDNPSLNVRLTAGADLTSILSSLPDHARCIDQSPQCCDRGKSAADHTGQQLALPTRLQVADVTGVPPADNSDDILRRRRSVSPAF